MSSIRISRALVPLMTLLLISAAGQGQGEGKPAILTACLHEKNYTIRFVYNPPIPQTNVIKSTTFKQVETRDARYGTWSTDVPLGLTQWISPEEMKALAEGLANLKLAWDVSRKPMVFRKELEEPPPPPPLWRWKVVMPRREGTMEIDATCDAGSAVADLPSERVCRVMEHLDGAFTNPTVVHTFRSARDEWGCRVPGFDPRETLPTFITRSEAAILVNLLPVASELRSKGSDIDWAPLNYPDLKGLNSRDYWFFSLYKGSRKAGHSALAGRFAVNVQTADVWDRDSGEQVHSRELELVQAVLRREHNISAAWIEYYRNHPLEQGDK